MKNGMAILGGVVALAVSAAAAVACAPAAKDDKDGSNNNNNNNPTADGGGEPSNPDGGGSSSGDGGNTNPGNNKPATSCSTGEVFAGNPVYDGEYLDRPATGTGIHADPPLQWQNMVFAGSKQLYTRDNGEVWGVDLNAANPVETRIAGLNDVSKFAYSAGPCATARIAKIEGMVALSDGSLLVADVAGNGVLRVTNPTNAATCAVEYYAGNTTANADLNLAEVVPNQGDVDGPGATAKLDSPAAMTVDAQGNAYVWDKGNHKIKKIGSDGAHTVTTVVKVPTATGPDQITNLAMIGTTIYAIGTDGTKAFVLGIDSANGNITPVVQGGGDKFPPLESTTYPALAGLTTDGSGLIISGKGYVWYVTTAGVVTQIAGTGLHIDFPEDGYDPKVKNPAMSLQLPPQANGSLIGSSDYVTYHEGSVYFRGHHQGTAAFVERITCP